ncbi:MAG: cytochrome C [Thermodesulfobacteriota bacterium]
MRAVRLSLVIMAAALLTFGVSGLAYAFHSGGVAECEGCHTMHTPATGGSFLLVGTDQSSACLTCHEHAGDTGPSSYHVSTPGGEVTAAPPKQRTPGGDFGWLKKNYSDTSGTNTYTEDGATHGHNIIAADFSYAADPTNTTAPGGTFPASQLGCQSCHDPHGQFRRLQSGAVVKTGAPIKASGSYNGTGNEPTATEAVGVYRLLAGGGYTKGPVTFNGVPAAKAPSNYNQGEATNQVRIAYGTMATNGHVAWGTWCSTCHTDMHSSTGYVHPTDENLGSTIAGLYNAYVKSGDMTGAQATSFTSLVPFATGNGADYAALALLAGNGNPTYAGPSSTDQVTCLSCHRAHASGNLHALRYDNGYEFTTINGQYVAIDNPSVTGSRAALQRRGRTIADWQATYYDRPATVFATYQRVLCNKCHAKD